MAARAKSATPATFEALYTELEETARKLEQGNLPLEESLALYEQGAALVAKLRVLLQGAEARIQTVHRGFEGDVDLGPSDDEPDFDDEVDE
ncbi:MAG: exodeoxyribonuclease VII small subunit [Dehalococcoidia bacterium]